MAQKRTVKAKLASLVEAIDAHLAAEFGHVGNGTEQLQPPYPWCHQPKTCIGLGYCPRDPNCGE
jgi:hypothetical protein